MGKLLNLAKWGLTLGREPQNFLGAGWIPVFLRRLPEKSRRKWALRILNLSPHYFIDGDNPEFSELSTDEYLETSFEIIAASRREISREVFGPHLEPDWTVLEYGCGPGFLAKAVAPNVKRLYACDISDGALACAAILNGAENIEYLRADEEGLNAIADASLDAVYSFAVVQHLTDEIFAEVLANCRRKLRPGGRLLFHVQLLDEVWKSEEEWRSDRSLRGRLKYRYGLHCFGRSREKHKELVSAYGFTGIGFESLAGLGNENSSDTDSQYLLTASRED